MLKLLERIKKTVNNVPVINFAAMRDLQNRLENELNMYSIPRNAIVGILQEVCEDITIFNLNPHKVVAVNYYDVSELQKRRKSKDGKTMYRQPELTVTLDRRDWQFNAVTGECLASGKLIGKW